MPTLTGFGLDKGEHDSKWVDEWEESILLETFAEKFGMPPVFSLWSALKMRV